MHILSPVTDNYSDVHVQVFPRDEHRGQGPYSAYMSNSKIKYMYTECSHRSDVTYLLGKCILDFSIYCIVSNLKFDKKKGVIGI